jgi:hypothetical protein
MGPNDLDDLLKSIRGEPKQDSGSSSLGLYKGTKGTDLVSELVDERILNLLGLQEVFDIDYATYTSLLREKAAAARMRGAVMESGEAELITNEFRRVKRKVGRFKINKKKISAKNVSIRKPLIQAGRMALPAAPVQSEAGQSLIPEVNEIDKKLDELIAAVRADFKQEKEKEKLERTKNENERRKLRERKLESRDSPVLNSLKRTARKIIAPFQAILDRILKFITFTLLGFGFDKIFKWFNDPNNSRKIEVIGRFLKDWWPTLLGAATLFFTPLGIFIKGIVGLLRRAIPTLLRLGLSNPIAAAGILGAGAVTYSILNNERTREEENRKNDKKIVTPTETRERGQIPSGSQLMDEMTRQRGFGGMFNSGGMVSPPSSNMTGALNTFNNGGRVTKGSGANIKGAGTDTQLIAASPGEIVIPNKAVNKYGANYFMDLIRSSGSSGVPRFINNIQFAQNGGRIGSSNGGMLGFSRVMQPQADLGPGYGRKTEGSGYAGKSQLNFLGIPVPFTQRREVFSESDVDRYNAQGGSRLIERMKPRRNSTLHRTIPNPNLTNKSFGGILKNQVDAINKAGQKKVERMREAGYTGPVEYDRMFQRAPQLRKYQNQSMISPPVRSSETQVIVLPPITKTVQKPQSGGKNGNDIPDFSPIASAAHRRKVTESLGIANLV